MIEKRFVIDRRTLTVREAYIEPEHEWCRMKSSDGQWEKIFNDIDPDTGERTGWYYREYEIFCTSDKGIEGLKAHIKNLIAENKKEANKLRERNKNLNAILKEL